MNDIECPYCEEMQEVNHDDGGGYEQDVAHDMRCVGCGKNFVFYTTISFDYHPQKADCLNGGAHYYSDWRNLWKNDRVTTQIRRCLDCDEEERRKTVIGQNEKNN